MTEIIIPNLSNLSNLDRRNLARLELEQYASVGKFRYLTRSPYIRHVVMDNGNTAHSIIDVFNVVYTTSHKDADIDFDPSKIWNNAKKQLVKTDIQLSQKIGKLKFPSWKDSKLYPTDILDTGWLFFLLVEMHTPITNDIRAAFADELNKYDREHHAAIISELDRETGWAGTAIHLQLKDTYAPDEFNEPKGVVGDYWK